MMNNRTPDASPFRQRPNNLHFGADPGGRSHSPESDFGYGTSFGSQEPGSGHTVDMDILSNLVVSFSTLKQSFSIVHQQRFLLQRSLSLSNGSRVSGSVESPVLPDKAYDPFAFVPPKIDSALEESAGTGPHDSIATESSKDDSVTEADPPRFQATVGPSLVELDPAVAHASKKYQVRNDFGRQALSTVYVLLIAAIFTR